MSFSSLPRSTVATLVRYKPVKTLRRYLSSLEQDHLGSIQQSPLITIEDAGTYFYEAETESKQSLGSSSRPDEDYFSSPLTYLPTLRDTPEAWTLPPSVYTDETFAKLEGTRIWQTRWICVGHTCHAAKPGDVLPFTLNGYPIFIANDNGTRHAFHNVCRHRGAKLVSECMAKKKTITCPYHRWGYSLSGKLVGTPMWDDTEKQQQGQDAAFSMDHVKGFDKTDFGLLPVRMEEWGGMMFVNLDGYAPPLEEYLGDVAHDLANYPLDELVSVGSKTYEVAANWKLMLENFLEYYHLPAVHPALCNVSGVDQHVDFQGKGMYSAFATAPLSKGNTPLDHDALPPFPGITEEQSKSAFHLSIFPNIFSSIYPHHTFRVIVLPHPTDPGKCIEQANLLVHPSVLHEPEAQEKIDAILAFHDNVNLEDIQICEQVQEGVKAYKFQGGRFSFKFEESVHRFQKMIADAMLGGFTTPEGYSSRAKNKR